MDAMRIIKLLDLKPLPHEGGYYRETYRSDRSVSVRSASGRSEVERSLSTAIYYLITPDSFSALHRLPGDEIFHFYFGDPVNMVVLYPEGDMETFIMGLNLTMGERPQYVAPGGAWQGMRLIEGGVFALMGTTMSPGFDFDDYEPGGRGRLIGQYPLLSELIQQYTRD